MTRNKIPTENPTKSIVVTRQRAIQAAKNLNVERGDSNIFDIAKRMVKVVDDGMNITPMSLCLNLALTSEPTYIEKIMAASVVADFIFRHMMYKVDEVLNQLERHVHPFSILINDDDVLKLSIRAQREFKDRYKDLTRLFSNQIRLDHVDGFIKKVQHGQMVFSHIATMTRKNSTFLRKHWKSFLRLLKYFTKRDFEDKDIVLKFLTKKNISLAINEMFNAIQKPEINSKVSLIKSILP
jgi:hypothetical protein